MGFTYTTLWILIRWRYDVYQMEAYIAYNLSQKELCRLNSLIKIRNFPLVLAKTTIVELVNVWCWLKKLGCFVRIVVVFW